MVKRFLNINDIWTVLNNMEIIFKKEAKTFGQFKIFVYLYTIKTMTLETVGQKKGECVLVKHTYIFIN